MRSRWSSSTSASQRPKISCGCTQERAAVRGLAVHTAGTTRLLAARGAVAAVGASTPRAVPCSPATATKTSTTEPWARPQRSAPLRCRASRRPARGCSRCAPARARRGPAAPRTPPAARIALRAWSRCPPGRAQRARGGGGAHAAGEHGRRATRPTSDRHPRHAMVGLRRGPRAGLLDRGPAGQEHRTYTHTRNAAHTPPPHTHKKHRTVGAACGRVHCTVLYAFGGRACRSAMSPSRQLRLLPAGAASLAGDEGADMRAAFSASSTDARRARARELVPGTLPPLGCTPSGSSLPAAVAPPRARGPRSEGECGLPRLAAGERGPVGLPGPPSDGATRSCASRSATASRPPGAGATGVAAGGGASASRPPGTQVRCSSAPSSGRASRRPGPLARQRGSGSTASATWRHQSCARGAARTWPWHVAVAVARGTWRGTHVAGRSWRDARWLSRT
jgi:hypothetical protein